MIPTYKPGDHVLTFNWGKIKKGDVVVFILPYRHPGVVMTTRGSGDSIDPLGFQNDKKNKQNERLMYVKRVEEISNDLVYVVGDNRKESAKFGSIRTRQIIGKVVLKY